MAPQGSICSVAWEELLLGRWARVVTLLRPTPGLSLESRRYICENLMPMSAFSWCDTQRRLRGGSGEIIPSTDSGRSDRLFVR